LAIVQSAPLAKGKLRFKISGRNLPDKDTGFGTTDGYYEFWLSNDGGRSKTKLHRSDTINDKENPDWGNIFDVDFDRTKDQWWYVKVYDEDNLREDDTVGRTWINAADYVDKGQQVKANLDKKNGYLIMQSVDKVDPVAPGVPIGEIPIASGAPTSGNIKFKLSANNLATKDDVGFIPGNSDPYVVITLAEGPSGKEKDVGRTSTVTSSSSPTWGDVFNINWDKNRDQRLHFKIYDDDTLREDDKLGSAWIEVNDFIAKGNSYTFPLPKKGMFTISKA